MDLPHIVLALGVCVVLADLLFPIVSAFPVGPGITGASATFTSTYSFPGVPLREGIRRIHTPEFLEAMNVSKKWGHSPYFDIQSVSQPLRYGDHVTVCLRCNVSGAGHTVFIIAKPEDPGSSTFMCVRDGVQRAAIRLRSVPTTYTDHGHRLIVTCVYPRGARVFDHGMEPILRFIRFFRRRGRPDTEHANLQWYRRMVIGLDDQNPASI